MVEDLLKIDPEKKAEEITQAIQDVFKEKGFTKAVLGLSGGLDSSSTAFLLVKALGKENVYGFILPCGDQDMEDSKEVARMLGIDCETIDISPMIETYFKHYPDADKVRRGNKMARERMSILYDHSRRLKALVVGTGNKTELLLGYFTQFGDGACAVAPLTSLYKTQLIQLAGFLGVPESVIQKKPTAGLWDGQTDEDEIGAPYEQLDKVLSCLEKGLDRDQITEKGIDPSVIDLVSLRMEKNRFKLEGTAFL